MTGDSLQFDQDQRSKDPTPPQSSVQADSTLTPQLEINSWGRVHTDGTSQMPSASKRGRAARKGANTQRARKNPPGHDVWGPDVPGGDATPPISLHENDPLRLRIHLSPAFYRNMLKEHTHRKMSHWCRTATSPDASPILDNRPFVEKPQAPLPSMLWQTPLEEAPLDYPETEPSRTATTEIAAEPASTPTDDTPAMELAVAVAPPSPLPCKQSDPVAPPEEFIPHVMHTANALRQSVVGDCLLIDETVYDSLEVRASPIHGMGIFSTIDLAESAFLMKYEGEIIGKAVSNKRERLYQENNIRSVYMFKVDDDMIIDATFLGNKARFINHSCNPNCYSLTDTSAQSILYFTARPIRAGEELTIDYHYTEERPGEQCQCGDPSCKSKSSRPDDAPASNG